MTYASPIILRAAELQARYERICADPVMWPSYTLRILPDVRDTWRYMIVMDGTFYSQGTGFATREECEERGNRALEICKMGAAYERAAYLESGKK